MPLDLLKHMIEHRWQLLALTGALRRSCGLFAGPDLAPIRGRRAASVQDHLLAELTMIVRWCMGVERNGSWSKGGRTGD